jgi:hypothetical protein
MHRNPRTPHAETGPQQLTQAPAHVPPPPPPKERMSPSLPCHPPPRPATLQPLPKPPAPGSNRRDRPPHSPAPYRTRVHKALASTPRARSLARGRGRRPPDHGGAHRWRWHGRPCWHRGWPSPGGSLRRRPHLRRPRRRPALRHAWLWRPALRHRRPARHTRGRHARPPQLLPLLLLPLRLLLPLLLLPLLLLLLLLLGRRPAAHAPLRRHRLCGRLEPGPVAKAVGRMRPAEQVVKVLALIR